MHILQILPSLTVGGVERGVVDLAKGLVERGHRVTVVSAGGPLVEPLTAAGATHVAWPVDAKQISSMWRCVPQVAQLITDGEVDLVHARSRVPGWIGWAAARRTRRMFLTTAHGFYAPHLASRVMVWGRLVIVPSESLARYLMERLQVPRERIRIIPRGVDLDAFQFHPLVDRAPGQPWRIGVFGRLSPIKGQEVAIRACAALLRRKIPIRLCLAGDAADAPMRRTLDLLIASLNIQDAVEWLGVRHDMPALIASMDLVLVPSVYPESFGRSVVEAQAVGRPVIASRIHALDEVITDGQTGRLVPVGDATAFADAIEQLVHDPRLRQRLVAAARQRVESEWTVDHMIDRTVAVYEECLTQPRVLIWKLGALGDVILATPTLRAVRQQFPRAWIALAVGRSAYEAVARCPYLDSFIIYDSRRMKRSLWAGRAFMHRLRQERFDLSIDLQNSSRTHWLAWWAGIPVRIGYRRKFGWLLNPGVRLPRVVLAPVAHQHYLLRQAGMAPAGDALELWPSELDQQAADQLLPVRRADQALIGLHPGGSARWQTKRWELARWARLCEALMQQGFAVVILGGPEEQALGQTLQRTMKQQPTLLIGRTNLTQLACVIRRCDLLLAHDSVSLHLAAAVGTPTVALFGPTDPRRHLPPTFIGQVIQKEMFCSPCYSPRCRTLTHACMKRISVEEVLKASLTLLAEAEPAGRPS